jgi:hypothetical protein
LRQPHAWHMGAVVRVFLPATSPLERRRGKRVKKAREGCAPGAEGKECLDELRQPLWLDGAHPGIPPVCRVLGGGDGIPEAQGLLGGPGRREIRKLASQRGAFGRLLLTERLAGPDEQMPSAFERATRRGGGGAPAEDARGRRAHVLHDWEVAHCLTGKPYRWADGAS